MSDALHMLNGNHPQLTLCGMWTRRVTLLGDDFDTDERPVCIRCTRVSIARRAHERIRAPQTETYVLASEEEYGR